MLILSAPAAGAREKPGKGRSTLDGRALAPSPARCAGVVFQRLLVIPALTVLGNVIARLELQTCTV